MTALLHNAWAGWQDYIGVGKTAALLIASLLFLWSGRRYGEQKAFLAYVSAMTAGCILPLTAVLLMKYQTNFYEYRWIWSMVPVTAAVAYGTVAFLGEIWEDTKHPVRALCASALLLSAYLLCGGLGAEGWDRQGEEGRRQEARRMVEALLEREPEGFCLWAPQEVMEYAREVSARVRLPYGRDMWDTSLAGYAYDTYGEGPRAMYLWMEQGSGSLEEAAELALETGVDCILLPGDMAVSSVRKMEEAAGAEVQQLGDYYLLVTSGQ